MLFMFISCKYDFICHKIIINFNYKIKIKLFSHFPSNLTQATEICFYDFCRTLLIILHAFLNKAWAYLTKLLCIAVPRQLSYLF